MKAVISPFPIEEALQRYARAGLPVHHATLEGIFGASQ
jgi:hypothetical protein